MIEEWNLKYKLGQVWEEAMRAAPEKTAPRVYQMAKDDKPEVRSLHYRIDAKLVKSLREEFDKEHGKDSVPVSSMVQARELDDLGAKTVMVTSTLQQLLAKVGPPLEEIKDKLKGKVTKRYSYQDLTPYETTVCGALVEVITLDYAIVDFNDATACRTDGERTTLLLSRELLNREAQEILKAVGDVEAKRTGSSLELLLLRHLARQWESDNPVEEEQAAAAQPA
jgi:hypothetical protein